MKYIIVPFLLASYYCAIAIASEDGVAASRDDKSESVPERVVADISKNVTVGKVVVKNALVFGVSTRVFTCEEAVFGTVKEGDVCIWEAPEGVSSRALLLSLNKGTPALVSIFSVTSSGAEYTYYERVGNNWKKIDQKYYYLRLSGIVTSRISDPVTIDVSSEPASKNRDVAHLDIPLGASTLHGYYASTDVLVGKIVDGDNTIWSSVGVEKVVAIHLFMPNNISPFVCVHLTSKEYGYKEFCFEKVNSQWKSLALETAKERIDSLADSFFLPTYFGIFLAIILTTLYTAYS